MNSNLWHSERLIYRGVEIDDEAFLSSLEHDEESHNNSSPFLPVVRSKKTAVGFREFLTDKCLLGCLVCLPSVEEPENLSKGTPIGIIHLTGGNEPTSMHHRHSDIGIMIARPHQGKGYGTEAILWIMRWGFRRSNLHRIGIGAFSWNPRAVKLYESLGFQVEARKRDLIWHDGKYRDVIELAILEDEWRDKYDRS